MPGTREKNLENLNNEIFSLYRDLDIDSSDQIRKLKLESFCNANRPHQEFPDLTRSIKARQVRYLIPVVAALCRNRGLRTEAQKHRFAAASHLQAMYSIVDANDWFVSSSDADAFLQHMNKFLLHYTWLAQHAFNLKLYKYSVVPKFHYCAHMGEQIRYLNLRATWCYGGETMAGIISTLGFSCLSGTPAQNVPTSLIGKYRVAIEIRLKFDH